MQDAFEEYCGLVRDKFSNSFWRAFAAVYKERVGVIDRVLKTTRDVFIQCAEKKRFASSVRILQKVSLDAAGDFCSHLMHEITVDLRNMSLPGNPEQSVKFRFINPLWAWIQAANAMVRAGKSMFFKPQIMLNRTGERVYGAGVQFGDAIKFAASRTPRDRKPALFGISFDGGDSGVSNRNVYPICVSALNFNGADPLQCGLVGFLPAIDVPASFKETERYRHVRARVLQECIGAVIEELENVARGGFTARIGEDLLHFQPFLVAVRVDSKERKTYFGLKSDRYTHVCHTYMTHTCV